MSTPTPGATAGSTEINFNDISFLEAQIESLRKCNPLPQDTVKQLCEHAKEILQKESNVATVNTPVTICGDIHG